MSNSIIRNKVHHSPRASAPTPPSLMIPSPLTPQNKPLLPKVGALPAGRYRSTILSVDYNIADNDIITSVDMIHELLDGSDQRFQVKFRYFTPHDTNKLLPILSSYGLKGDLRKVVGLAEEVEITPKTNSSYLVISNRWMCSPPTSVPSSPSEQALLEDTEDEYEEYLDLLDDED